ncbi:PREDICTED: telomere repeat-binding factor 4-like [Tarenaya hassleriana]|uniref:telomere repeat-binding factor 4-like n=1 Tax=Tarenaya hassleriana TaxID=28532 RepID=UPI00053C5EEA|nr:PREDICTED: telomere repeat-binding factor 4-like [Tarenaya hassleriana]
MGNQKQKWTAEEEEALLAGIAKHGSGKWKNILRDPDFAPHLIQRSNIDLKDKWRNLNVSSSGQSTREKSRTPKIKAAAIALAAAGTPPTLAARTPSVASLTPNTPDSSPALSLVSNGPSPMDVDDLSNSTVDVKNNPRYNAMVFEAISTINNVNGVDIFGIFSFIEKRHNAPQNFRKLLGSRLRRLVSQGKLEKVENRYRICNDTRMATKETPALNHLTKPRLPSTPPVATAMAETREEAATAAAYKVAEAENKAFLAAEAVKEAEGTAKLAEDSNSMLQIALDIYELCDRGEEVFVG